MLPELGGPGGPLALPIFGRSVNPIPTGDGQIMPTITTGPPKVFHLPLSLQRTIFSVLKALKINLKAVSCVEWLMEFKIQLRLFCTMHINNFFLNLRFGICSYYFPHLLTIYGLNTLMKKLVLFFCQLIFMFWPGPLWLTITFSNSTLFFLSRNGIL